MLQNLQTVIELINNNSSLSQEEKTQMIASLKEADKKFSITEFKLDRTEKVKRTTAILLEETIEELENKRKAVEVQNRELEIEAALERVRAIALSMKEAADMLDVCKTIAVEMDKLGVKEIRNVQTAIFYESKGTYMNYEYYAKHDKTFITETSYTNSEMHLAFAEQMLKGNGEFFITHIKGEEVKDWIAYQKTTNVFIDTFLETASSLNYYWFSLGEVALGISTYEPLREQDINLFKRFVKVFALAYRRYLDIEKAEAQAKEAKVEAALEKVRSRSLAVHNSDEFNEVIKVVFERLQELKIPMTSVSINVIIEDSKDTEAYICGSGEDGLALSHIRLIHFDHPISNDRYDAYEKGLEFFTKTYNAEEKNSFYEYEFEVSDLKYIPADVKKMVMESKRYTCSVAFTRNSMIVVNDFEGKSLSSKEIDIVKRFSKVFEQAYVRFLDLKKAEAQARESQIQLALERVRARTMAMQHSDELADASFVLDSQVRALGIKTRGCAFNIYGENNSTEWFSSEMGTMPAYKTPRENIFLPYYEAGQKGESLLIKQFSGEACAAHYEYLCTLPVMGDALKQMIADGGSFPKQQVDHVSYFKYGYLLFITLEPVPEAHDIFKRFASVFEQTYTRFLDLQKAEAQSRESQIQLALERLRARTMAMQHSNELLDAATLLFQQIKSLGTSAWNCSFNFWTEDKKQAIAWNATKDGFGRPFNSPSNQDVFQRFYEASLKGEELYVEAISGDALKHHYDYLSTLPGVGETLAELKAAGVALPTFQIFNIAYFTQGYLMFITYEPVPELWDIFKRFAKVFEQTYTRFLDLQKAEAQAREAQIEAALEKVRSSSLAMHHSKELSEVVTVVFEKLKELNFLVNDGAAIILTFIENSKDHIEWIADPTQSYSMSFKIPYSHHSMSSDLINARESGTEFFSRLYSFEEKNAYFNYLFQHTDYRNLSEDVKKVMLESEHMGFSVAFKKNSAILIPTNIGVLLTDEQQEILKRFSKVFEQSYTRFLDLQKAEAQAREAQIEASLERVRSRSLAMHKTSEIQEVIHTVHDELLKLNISIVGGSFIVINKDVGAKLYAWGSGGTADTTAEMLVPDFGMPFCIDLIKGIKKGAGFFTEEFSRQEKIEYFQELFKHEPWSKLPAKDKQAVLESEGAYTRSVFVSKYTSIFIINQNGRKFAEAENDILKRFGKVFDQTYTRFLDLQKAEAQARESQIQLALERVRARTMAMQKSDELTDVAGLLFEQVDDLGIKTWTAGFNVWSEDNNTYEDYITSPKGGFILPYVVDTSKASVLRDISNARKKGDEFSVQYAEGQRLKETYIQLAAFGDEKQYDKMLEDGVQFPSHQYNHFVFGSKVSLMFITYEPVPEAHDIFKRLGKVFEQTYTRFLDLQKAEAQAREAKIEAALERVRSRSMAMQKSEDLHSVVNTLYGEFKSLNVNFHEAAIRLLQDDSMDLHLWLSTADGMYENIIHWPYTDLPIFHAFQEARTSPKVMEHKMSESETKKFFEEYFKLDAVPKERKGATENVKFIDIAAAFQKFTCVFLMRYTEGSYSYYEKDIISRFSKVFEQTYTRFLDLQKAEAQAREAQIETALERVRSRTLAMQKSDELSETAAVLFQQLIYLGIEPNRLYIGIMKDDEGETEFWITDEEGSKVSMAYEDNLNNNTSFNKMFDGWKQQKKSLVIDMHGQELEEYFNHLNSIHVPFKGGLTQKRRLQYIAYFSKGFIGMASPDDQPKETIDLLERFAYVFNLTFTRFKDLQIAEAHALQAEHDLIEIKGARKKAEETLAELQSTQKQLIQSEKMASLGELTAGIAHEIQNPLNFVNNFSEVSKELLDEMRTALQNGDAHDAQEIANDVIQNLEKINHHGKRADAIVKGMLQHSRSTTRSKELTDINALCEEYIRLCYHGLRAKDNYFNATIKTDFDRTIEKINIIPQDISRVVLNVLTNAFYAVNERAKLSEVSYQPLVSVKTKSKGNSVLVTVSDNGNGIPQSIVDKIFQPFYTTKPTGQGTGLGLSLSYDIIKAHSGELKVETKQGEGSEFIIQLPIV